MLGSQGRPAHYLSFTKHREVQDELDLTPGMPHGMRKNDVNIL